MVVRKRLDITTPGLFLVTTTVVDWTPVFARPDVAAALLRQFSETSQIYRAAIVAYVLMPSHFHLLVGMENGGQLRAYMQAFKSLSARRIKKMDIGEFHPRLWMEGRYALWRRGFDDLLIYSEKQFKAKLEYIHNNPVKADLVTNPAEYSYSSARDWVGCGSGMIPVTKDIKWIPTG